MDEVRDFTQEEPSLPVIPPEPDEPTPSDEYVRPPLREFTRRARQALRGRWGDAVLMNLLFSVLMILFAGIIRAVNFVVIGLFTLLSPDAGPAVASPLLLLFNILEIAVLAALTLGCYRYFLRLFRGEELQIADLFAGFRQMGTALGVRLLSTLIILLWTLLLIIPGIIASYRYSMIYFVLADDPSCGVLEALRRSAYIMQGRKWAAFLLSFRFIGWAILSLFTFGFGVLWLAPYIMSSYAAFYEDAKRAAELRAVAV
jgi:uncharacterized membrane protein